MAKILIVDDDPDIVEASTLFLEKAGHQVEAAYNREGRHGAPAPSRPDLLILDVMMEQPDDGFAMAQDLRRQGTSSPSSCSPPWHRPPGLAFGKDAEMVPVDDFQAKPVEPANLVEKVASSLKR